ncbi:hypothetical protein C2G38_2031518 [Gigaspora rosea]|uniref:Uncharacterized protein n=1 Tax=Gigaspora rosea TaxID=44941 RepID=A0A397VSI3_9GLOM|nr:hypothetical protein C2G38_2031518 [Gigaspora rosea]
MEYSSVDYQNRVERLLDRTRLTTTSRSETNGHVNTDKGEKKKKTKPVDSSPNVGPENKKQEKEKPRNGKQKAPRERINICRNDDNDQKKENKKDTLDDCVITDDPEDPLNDIRNLFDLECGYLNGIKFKKDEHKVSVDD